MIRSQGRLLPMPSAELTWTENGEPRSVHYEDTYFSTEHGYAETQHVFIEGSRLCERVGQHPRTTFVVGELGFGTALNFLLTCKNFLEHAPQSLRLHYWAIDRYPLPLESLRRAMQRWPELAPQAESLIAVYPPLFEGVHRRSLNAGRIIVDFVWSEAEQALADLAGRDQPFVDAWFLDGFAPARNASMWTDSLFRHIASSSHANASVATYSSASAVQKGLRAVGFEISKRSGYGPKRECLSGHLPTRREATPSPITPWDLATRRSPASPTHVLVLGAGLAGAHVAAALAQRGLQVNVLEASTAAAGASGNPQGVLFTRVSHQRSTLVDFSLLAFSYARNLYADLFAKGLLREGLDGALDGCFQSLSGKPIEPALLETLGAFPEIAQVKSAAEASQLLGSRIPNGGLWQPGSGWLSPPAVCRALLEHDNIRLQEQCGKLELRQAGDGKWQVLNAEGQRLAEADTVVIALGSHSRNLFCTQDLPLKVVRGQTTQIPLAGTTALRRAFCHRGYIAPPINGAYCIGASFTPDDEDTSLRTDDHRANIAALTLALPDWAESLDRLNPDALIGRAELRCVSPDYLPLAGPVPRSAEFRSIYAALKNDARQPVMQYGSYYPGLYLDTAMGSRGLSYAALTGEILASQICGEPAPVSRELQRALSPARFVMRGIIRGEPKPRSQS